MQRIYGFMLQDLQAAQQSLDLDRAVCRGGEEEGLNTRQTATTAGTWQVIIHKDRVGRSTHTGVIIIRATGDGGQVWR